MLCIEETEACAALFSFDRKADEEEEKEDSEAEPNAPRVLENEPEPEPELEPPRSLGAGPAPSLGSGGEGDGEGWPCSAPEEVVDDVTIGPGGDGWSCVSGGMGDALVLTLCTLHWASMFGGSRMRFRQHLLQTGPPHQVHCAPRRKIGCSARRHMRQWCAGSTTVRAASIPRESGAPTKAERRLLGGKACSAAHDDWRWDSIARCASIAPIHFARVDASAAARCSGDEACAVVSVKGKMDEPAKWQSGR